MKFKPWISFSPNRRLNNERVMFVKRDEPGPDFVEGAYFTEYEWNNGKAPKAWLVKGRITTDRPACPKNKKKYN